MKLAVETARGTAADHEPRSFLLGAQRVVVVEIIDRWLSPTHSYFKVRTDDGSLYILRHDLPTGQWEMTLFRSDHAS